MYLKQVGGLRHKLQMVFTGIWWKIKEVFRLKTNEFIQDVEESMFYCLYSPCLPHSSSCFSSVLISPLHCLLLSHTNSSLGPCPFLPIQYMMPSFSQLRQTQRVKWCGCASLLPLADPGTGGAPELLLLLSR